MVSVKVPHVDKSPDRIRQMFDTTASRYDLLNHLLSFGIDYTWRYRTARQIVTPQLPDGDILDVCCGTGDLSLAFIKRQQKISREQTNRERTNIGTSFIGIDFSAEMLAIAKKKAADVSLLSFVEGDALNLPFENNQFAAVAVAFGLRNVHDVQCGLAEMNRVCKPKGTVAVLEFSMPALPIIRQFYRFYFHSILPFIGHRISNNQDGAYNYLTESILQFDTPAQLAERLRQAGLVNVQVRSMTFGIASLVWGIKP